MNMRVLLAGVAALALTSTAANAAIVVSSSVANQLYTVNSGAILWDFDSIANPNVTYSNAAHPAFVAGGTVSDSAPPPYSLGTTVDGPGGISICCQSGANYLADPTKYGSVQNEETPPGETFTALNGRYFTSFSFYMGSPDTYNRVTFNFVGGGAPQVFNGSDIWGGPNVNPGNGDRTVGYRIYYDFNGAKVSSINFQSVGSDAFEFDGLAGTLAVPEPTTWGLMILGFGGVGATLRSRRRLTATA